MQERKTIEVDMPTVGCDGGHGPHGHPMVYLPLGEGGEVECPYCGRHFVLKVRQEAD